jgi:hypothetical protein
MMRTTEIAVLAVSLGIRGVETLYPMTSMPGRRKLLVACGNDAVAERFVEPILDAAR